MSPTLGLWKCNRRGGALTKIKTKTEQNDIIIMFIICYNGTVLINKTILAKFSLTAEKSNMLTFISE